MEGCPLGSRRLDEPEFTLKEWNLKGRISRENTSSRRFSGSYIRSFREESNRSFRSNITISSTASSPGYHLKDEIDPSTYSFTTALKALQARSGYVWECLSPDGFALNSKWHEAERYICNPLSGQFPTECLSSKSLSGRSFHNIIAGRITMSAPLVYSSRRFNNCPKPPMVVTEEKDHNTKAKPHLPLQVKETGIQSSTPPDQSPCSISYCSSPLPPNKEESSNCCEASDEKEPSSNFNPMEEGLYTLFLYELRLTLTRTATARTGCKFINDIQVGAGGSHESNKRGRRRYKLEQSSRRPTPQQETKFSRETTVLVAQLLPAKCLLLLIIMELFVDEKEAQRQTQIISQQQKRRGKYSPISQFTMKITANAFLNPSLFASKM